jgi:hypothetical protein
MVSWVASINHVVFESGIQAWNDVWATYSCARVSEPKEYQSLSSCRATDAFPAHLQFR